MKSKGKSGFSGKGRRKMSGWVVGLIIVAVLAVGGGIGWSALAKEHAEARSLLLNTVDFSNLQDGTYVGDYEGGMYKWRVNTAKVTVKSGKVADIELLSPAGGSKDNMQQEALYDRVIQKQSLQVDLISGATLTSKAYLQAVENALKQAQK
jgi:uncharacterized protein with FMN-binding domain